MHSDNQLEKRMDFRQNRLLENMSRILLISKVFMGVVAWIGLFDIFALLFSNFQPPSSNDFLPIYITFGLFNGIYFYIVNSHVEKSNWNDKEIAKWEKIVNTYIMLSTIWGITASFVDPLEYKYIFMYFLCIFVCSSIFYIALKQAIIWNLLNTIIFIASILIIHPHNTSVGSLFYLFLLMVFVSFLLSRIVYRAFINSYFTKLQWQHELEKNMELTRELQLTNKQLAKQAHHDELTGVLNRHGFQEHVQSLFENFDVKGAMVSIILIDIDYFKYFNDLYGHSSGDEVLKAVAQSIARIADKNGHATVRWGGEEFIVVGTDLSKKQMNSICQEIENAISKLSIQHNDSSVSQFVTVSIGASMGFCATPVESEGVIEHADHALYHVKNQGRNSYLIVN